MTAQELARQIESWPLERLRPYERNACTHSQQQVAKIAASIQEFGFTNPILVDADSGIVAGHGRLAAARLLGLDQVPVIELTHLSPAQVRAYRLADNRLAREAGWDAELLALELQELELEGFNPALTGFDDDEIKQWLAPPPESPLPERPGRRASLRPAMAI